jgi:LDH2 family malate/lactate/ureidoglycolate dehydrogenase
VRKGSSLRTMIEMMVEGLVGALGGDSDSITLEGIRKAMTGEVDGLVFLE